MVRSLRSQWLNVALVVVAVALVAVVFVTRGNVTTGEREAREDNLLSAYRPGELSRITFDGDKHIVLTKVGDEDAGDVTWNIAEPIQEEADTYAIDKLLGSLEFARKVRSIDPQEVDRSAFGLEHPKWVMGIQMGEIHYELRLGKEAAQPPGAHYLEVQAKGAPGSGVVIVSRDLAKELGIELADLRGRLVMPYFSSSLSRIELGGSGGDRKLTSLGNNRWRFDGMLGGVRVNREIFDQVLLQFARTKADEFLSEKEAIAALGKDRVIVRLTPKDKKDPPGLVEVGGRCPKNDKDVVALRRKPDVLGACVPASVMVGLTLPAEKLVDRTLFATRKDEVESISMQLGPKKLELDRKEDGFSMTAPLKATVKLEAGNQWLDKVLGAEGALQDEPDLAALGLSPPRGHILVKYIQETDSQLAKARVDIGKRTEKGGLWVRREQDGAVLELSPQAAEPIRVDTTLVRDTRVLDFKPSALHFVEVTREGTTQRFVREASGQFVLEKPKGFDADPGLCADVVDALSSLTAERWVADDDDGSFGLSRPTLQVGFSFDEQDAGATSMELVVGTLIPGGAYAKLEKQPGVFVMSRRALDALETLLLDRSVFMLNPGDAKKVFLERNGKKIELVYEGDHYTQASGPPLGATAVTRAMDALSGLRAEAAVHVGAARADEGLQKPRLTVRIEPPGTGKPRVLTFGAGDDYRNTSIVYARSSGVDATYAIAKSKLSGLFDAL